MHVEVAVNVLKLETASQKVDALMPRHLDQRLVGMHEEQALFAIDCHREEFSGELHFDAHQAFIEFTTYAYGVMKAIVDNQSFDYTTKARRAHQPQLETIYNDLVASTAVTDLNQLGDQADAILKIFGRAMRDSSLPPLEYDQFMVRFEQYRRK